MADTPFDELISWRDRAIADGTLREGTLKDAQLSQIVRSGRTGVEDIHRMLPRSARPVAGDIARILGGGGSAGGTGGATAAPGAGNAAPAGLAEPAAPETARVGEPRGTGVGQTASSRHARPEQSSAAEAGGARRQSTPAAPAAGADTPLPMGHQDFADFVYGVSEHEIAEAAVAEVPEGYRVSWPPMGTEPGGTVIYRVVAGDDTPPYKPEAGVLVAATRGTSAVDERPLDAAVRHIQVWAHTGPDTAAAAANQPVLIAQCQLVGGVSRFAIAEEEGAVIGQWTARPGVTRVRVMRIPLDEQRRGPDAQYRINAAEANLTGFVDRGAQRGKPYLYKAVCEVELDGVTRLSKPAQAEVVLSVVLEPVTDLTVRFSDNGNQMFDLDWTDPPAGHVVVYRTQAAPKPGISDAALTAAALAAGGLPEAAVLKYPLVATDRGGTGMRRVPLPTGWPRAYFTPVTTMGDAVQVGTTVNATRPLPPVENVRLVERCFQQILTYAWPDGAASVSVFVSTPEVPVEQVLAQNPVAEVSRNRYERDGGLRMPNLLAPGCVVHVVPVAYAGGRRIMGEPASVRYPGLLRLWYMLEPVATEAGIMVRIAISPEIDNSSAPPFVLVHNATRLPLSPSDGTVLTVGDDVSGSSAKLIQPAYLAKDDTAFHWTASVGGLEGYLRLFADVRPSHARSIAVIDPPMQRLRIMPPGGPR